MYSLTESPATLALIVLTAGVSLIAFGIPQLWRYLALEPFRAVRDGYYHQVITSGLVHANFGHLFINMLVLFFFGPALENAFLGGTGFLIVYLASLIAGSIYPLIKYRNRPDYLAVGASGAVNGVVFAFCLFDPLRMLYVFFLIPMPAIVFALLYVGYSVYAMKQQADNIGHEAHLGGAVGGIITTIILDPGVPVRLIENVF